MHRKHGQCCLVKSQAAFIWVENQAALIWVGITEQRAARRTSHRSSRACMTCSLLVSTLMRAPSPFSTSTCCCDAWGMLTCSMPSSPACSEVQCGIAAAAAGMCRSTGPAGMRIGAALASACMRVHAPECKPQQGAPTFDEVPDAMCQVLLTAKERLEVVPREFPVLLHLALQPCAKCPNRKGRAQSERVCYCTAKRL